jgi:hypothetical protein
MYVNAKMIPVEIIPGNRGEGNEGVVEGVNSSMIYLTHCKNFVNTPMFFFRMHIIGTIHYINVSIFFI